MSRKNWQYPQPWRFRLPYSASRVASIKGSYRCLVSTIKYGSLQSHRWMRVVELLFFFSGKKTTYGRLSMRWITFESFTEGTLFITASWGGCDSFKMWLISRLLIQTNRFFKKNKKILSSKEKIIRRVWKLFKVFANQRWNITMTKPC